jgi:pimeloyl-ACP methyl ester carboxylesterase
MAVLSELRYPTTRIAKVLSVVLALLLFAFVSIATIAGILLYQILRPARNPTAPDLNVMMGHPTAFSFTVANGSSREGWFFPGLRGAPTIVVSHGYGSQREEVLTLVSTLQDHGFNAFVFNFVGHGSSPGVTTLGYRETAELRAAIQALSTRGDVDPKHFGLWGLDMGAYASLEVATSDSRISALAVDSPYSDPRALVQIETRRSGLAVLPYVSKFCDFGFRMAEYPYRHEAPVTLNLIRLKGVPKLFIQADDRPELTNETLLMFSRAPDPKQLVRNRASYLVMNDDDRKTYENQIVSFFLLSIPPTGRADN